MLLVVGLGNPGERYAGTRHNVGAQLVEQAAARWSIVLKPAASARWGIGQAFGQEVALAIPSSWMNHSGPPVAELLERLGLTPSQLVVVHDDLDLELGRIRIKQRGGSGGHNGVLSIITVLQTDEFSRLKLGIGRPTAGTDPAEFVLSPFSSDELITLRSGLSRGLDALECLAADGVTAAMNRFNVRLLD